MPETETCDLSGIEWEETDCPLCGGEDGEDLLNAASSCRRFHFRIARCRACGMDFLNPRPNRATIHLLYPDSYSPYAPPEREPSQAGWQVRLKRLVMAREFGNPSTRGAWHERLVAALARPWLLPHRQSMVGLPWCGAGRLLDYGCGSGKLLRKLQTFGWQVSGMDMSAYAVEQLQARYGISGWVGSLPHPAIAPGSLDVIVMAAVLEHVHDPHALIAAAATALAPGGYLAITVPNIASWGFRYFRSHWWGLRLPHHLLHFTPQTLSHLLTSHGLACGPVEQIGRPGWMKLSLGIARGSDDPQFRSRRIVRLARPSWVVRSLADWTERRGEADCLRVLAHKPAAVDITRAA